MVVLGFYFDEWVLVGLNGDEVVLIMVLLFCVNVVEVFVVVVWEGMGVGGLLFYLVIGWLCSGYIVCVMFEYWLYVMNIYVLYLLC